MTTLSSIVAQSLSGAVPAPKFIGALYTLTSSFTINNTNPTITAFNTVVYDTSPGGILTSVSSKFTIPAGVTKVQAWLSLGDPTSVTEQIIASIKRNESTDTSYSTNFDIDSTGGDFPAAFTAPMPVSEGDVIEAAGFASTSRTVDVSQFSWFAIQVVEGDILKP